MAAVQAARRAGGYRSGAAVIVARTVTLLSVLMLGACAHHYTPAASRPFEAIDEFSSTKAVNLRNGQPSTAEVLFYDPVLNAHSYYANLAKWTDVAIEIAGREMKKRGMTIANGAPKSLTLSILSAHTTQGAVTIHTEITMQAKTSDGYVATYVGRNSSGMVALIYRQVDGALMRVVHEMFLDPHIIAFFTK
jgi:hypothetical protein